MTTTTFLILLSAFSVISGLVVEDIDYNDEFATPTLDGSNYAFHLFNNTITITITDTDVVTVVIN